VNLKEETARTVTAGILTGGGSRRFGENKSLYSWKGKTLLEWTLGGARLMTDEVVLLAKKGEDYAFTGVPVLEDAFSQSTPLNGIQSVIPRVSDWLLLLACDIPFFDRSLLELLWEFRSPGRATLIRSGGKFQPFLALYHREVLNLWEDAFRVGEFHIQKILEGMPRNVLEEEFLQERGIDPHCLANINTPEDLAGVNR